LAVFDPRRAQPLAIFPTDAGTAFYRPTIRADGLAVAVTVNGAAASGGLPLTAIYHKVGWDCPESSLGALAFPSTWVIVVCFSAAVILAYRDARRARLATATVDLVPQPVAAGLLAIAAPVTVVMLLAACLGRVVITPAPLLVVAACGLATQGRLWRAITMVVLFATLISCVYTFYCLTKVAEEGFSWTPLDRTHELPRAAPFVALVFCGVAVGGAIMVIVARSVRVRA
jgi:hypothetical protein